MTDLLKKFSAAAETVKSNSNPVRVCVYGAYREHLKDINPDDLPENIQICYKFALVIRITCVRKRVHKKTPFLPSVHHRFPFL